MTDIREKVARAICESEMGLEMLDAMPNTAPRYYSAADAALLACGYAEMRKALINLRQRTMSDGTPCFCGVGTLGPMTMEHYNWCREARSILERTGEK